MVIKVKGAQQFFVLLMASLLLFGCAATGPGTGDTGEKADDQAKTGVDPKASAAFESALAAMKAGNNAQAEKQLLQLTQDFPAFSGPHVNLGILYFREGSKEKARAAFKRALELNPKSAVSLNHLGIMSRSEGRFKEAYSYYEKALQAAPDYAYAHRNLGILLDLYMGKLEEALEHYKRYQELTEEEDQEVKKWIVDLERRVKKG